MRHLISLSKCRMFDTIAAYSSDTDALLICLAYHRCEFDVSICTIFCKIGLGPSSKIYNVIINARVIGLNTCQVLPFFHAFTGSNAVSSFFNNSKKSMWKAWCKYPNHYRLTQKFKSCNSTPERIYPFQLDEVENFLKFLYNGEVSMESLDALRMNKFGCSTANSLRKLPPSRDGIITEHIKRTFLQGGYEWRRPVKYVDFIGPIR